MNNRNLWIVSAKLQRLEGAFIDDDGSKFYYVECLIPTNSYERAYDAVEHLLSEKQMKLISVIKCEVYDPEQWKDTVQFRQIEKAATYTQTKNEPKFALFISSEAMAFNEGEECSSYGVEWD